ncbi:MAG: DNA alkylation repair protein [Planctomycetota bacterium]|nr:DNA alkylation repair protein [Planctomycetota bacterium]
MAPKKTASKKKLTVKKPSVKKTTKKSATKKNATTKTPRQSSKEILSELEGLGTEQVRKQNRKRGAHDKQYGVKLGDIRKIAKSIKTDHELGLALWKTENIDARFLAILILDGATLSMAEIDDMVQSMAFDRIADWFISYIIKKHSDKEALRQKWMNASCPMSARAGWSLTAERIAKNPEGLDLKKILDRIEKELVPAPPLEQWTMNFALVEIGINAPKLRQRALKIGETLGVYKDFPTSKGCTSPFAPIWINEMVRRQA